MSADDPRRIEQGHRSQFPKFASRFGIRDPETRTSRGTGGHRQDRVNRWARKEGRKEAKEKKKKKKEEKKKKKRRAYPRSCEALDGQKASGVASPDWILGAHSILSPHSSLLRSKLPKRTFSCAFASAEKLLHTAQCCYCMYIVRHK